jgi:hypothetical protein
MMQALTHAVIYLTHLFNLYSFANPALISP